MGLKQQAGMQPAGAGVSMPMAALSSAPQVTQHRLIHTGSPKLPHSDSFISQSYLPINIMVGAIELLLQASFSMKCLGRAVAQTLKSAAVIAVCRACHG